MSVVDVDDSVEVEIDPDDEVFEKYLKEPQPCFVLREDLPVAQLYWLAQTYCMVDFYEDGKRRFGILTKIYKHDLDEKFTKEAFDRTLEWFLEGPTNASSKKV